MNKATLSLVLLLLSLISLQCHAQFTYELNQTTHFTRIGNEDCVSIKLTMCKHQDKYGFIWVGTQVGLYVYDGYNYTVFTAKPENPEAFFNDLVYSLYEEEDGAMWISTESGLSRYNRSNKTFSNFLPDSTDIHSDRNIIQNILE